MSYFTPSGSCKIFVTGASWFQDEKYELVLALELKPFLSLHELHSLDQLD